MLKHSCQSSCSSSVYKLCFIDNVSLLAKILWHVKPEPCSTKDAQLGGAERQSAESLGCNMRCAMLPLTAPAHVHSAQQLMSMPSKFHLRLATALQSYAAMSYLMSR